MPICFLNKNLTRGAKWHQKKPKLNKSTFKIKYIEPAFIEQN